MAEQESTTTEDEKRPVGRPLLFKTVEALDAKIDEYLGDCAPHISKTKVLMEKSDGSHYWAEQPVMTDQKPITVSGAAFFLGTNRRTLLDYKERSDFLPSILRLLAACEAYAESMLFTQAANGAKFNLINNYRGRYQDWAERVEHSGPDGKPAIALVEFLEGERPADSKD